VQVKGFRGVINTTTNHILVAMEQGRAFSAALADMQSAGIAEADASLDIDGWDAAAKVAALANVWLDARMTPHDVERTGISRVTLEDVRRAVEQGNRLKLVASARRYGDKVEAVVQAIELPGDDLLAGLSGDQNALIVDTDLLGEIGIAQLTSGLTQTAYALVSDLLSIASPARRAV
jgi:homoserine dehydrogenase